VAGVKKKTTLCHMPSCFAALKNVKVDFQDYNLNALITSNRKAFFSSFTPATGAQEGLPPRFCAVRNSSVNELCPRLYGTPRNIYVKVYTTEINLFACI